MSNEIVMERKSNLVLPEGFVSMDEEEMMYIDGGEYVISSGTCESILSAFMGIGWFVFVGYSIACAIVGATAVIGAISAVISAIPGLLTVGIYAAAYATVFAGYLVTAAVTKKDLHIGTILGFIPNPRKMWIS